MARILIIDDNLDMLSMLQMILEKREGHQVLLHSSPKEGLGAAISEAPDLALVDVMMPEMSGYEVVKRLRANPQTKNLGIIILTARGQPVDHDAAMDAGADDFITKPVNVDELMEHINTVLDYKKPKKAAFEAKILPVFSLRGGVGTTTVAVNLATLLQFTGPTILLDLSPNSGHCALFLSLRPETHWGNFLNDPKTPINTLFLKHPSGLRLLAAPLVPLECGWFSNQDIEGILQKLKPLARYIVVDSPAVLNQATDVVLSQASCILLVTGDDPPAIQTSITTLQALQTRKDRTVIVRNINTTQPHPPIDAIQKALRTPIIADIAFDPAQSSALRKGIPLVAAQPKGQMANALKNVVKIIMSL